MGHQRCPWALPHPADGELHGEVRPGGYFGGVPKGEGRINAKARTHLVYGPPICSSQAGEVRLRVPESSLTPLQLVSLDPGRLGFPCPFVDVFAGHHSIAVKDWPDTRCRFPVSGHQPQRSHQVQRTTARYVEGPAPMSHPAEKSADHPPHPSSKIPHHSVAGVAHGVRQFSTASLLYADVQVRYRWG